jgi:predicted GIY-YIG superfamily endonuclease
MWGRWCWRSGPILDPRLRGDEYPTITEAIAREKAIKKWNRAWKLALIERSNPAWEDLYRYLVG